MKKQMKPKKKTNEKKKGYTVEEIYKLLDLIETEKKELKKPLKKDKKIENNLSEKDENVEPKDSIKEKKQLSKKEINELLNILDDIPEPKEDNKNEGQIQKSNINQDQGNVLNNIDKKMNDLHQLNIKNTEKDKKNTVSEFKNLNESENQPHIEEGVHHHLGFADINYFRKIIADNQGSIIFPLTSFELEDVEEDGNCGYRALVLQIYENENYYYKIREDIYKYLKFNTSNFAHLNFQNEGCIISADEYIEKVKDDGFWMGDLEISVVNKIYEATLYIYELRDDQNFYLLSKYVDINDDTKLFLNLCFVDNNHYNILYEKKGLI